MMSGYNLQDLIQEAQYRWLRPGEVLFILQNYKDNQLNDAPPQKPPSGSLFLFNKRVLRFFRKDGHSWRRKKDGKNVGEAHERLKVGNVEALSCYYAHGEQNPNFQRRSYWMLDSAMEHIVLVHYRDITIGKHSAGPISTLMLGSSNIANSYTTPLTSSASEYYEPYNGTSGPSSLEVSPDVVITSTSNGGSHLNLTETFDDIDGSPGFGIDQALRKLEEQLSLDHLKDFDTFYGENEYADELGFTINEQDFSGSERLQHGSDNYVSLPTDEFPVPNQQTLIWNDVQKYDGSTTYDGSLEYYGYPSDKNELLLPQPRTDRNDSSILPSQALEASTFPTYTPTRNIYQSDADLYSTLFDQETPLASDSSLTIAQDQKFTIREISPDWAFATEPTKVLIVGSFTCDPSDSEWICMFGDMEVPVEIIQEGVISCQAPPHLPGKVTICITCGNREACSEVREFEYRDKPTIHVTETDESHRTPEEVLLLVKFVHMLVLDKVGQNGNYTIADLPEGSMGGEDPWGQVIEALSDGSLVSSRTTDWLVEELVKDKFQRWILSKNTLSKKEQGIIHMVSGLGFVWALTPILKSGVGINFRDGNGWTALHWAARFGREKMVAEVLACGANAGAVTDPCQQDPSGKTPASIAEKHGHQGLAGYLSEMALTTHLSSLTLRESELSKGSADVEAERTVNSISDLDSKDLKYTLAAVRNAAQAAARIQAAFRAHSFKKRKQKEAEESACENEYGILPSEMSSASKAVFGNARDHNAALSIQKKYRGWKGRRDFLSLRQKVVKIQAHVRGYQARMNYETICWAVGVVEKIVLRWYRRGVGLRGFHVDAADNEQDIAKAFRKQKVDAALTEAVSRVLTMVNSKPARQQYQRMLHKYRLAKAQRGEGASTSAAMEGDGLYDLM